MTATTTDYRARLLHRRAELMGHDLARLGAAEALAEPLDQMVAIQLREEAARLLDIGARALREVDAAILLFDAGKYGWCCECGDEISERRLAARPESVLCVRCAEVA